MNSLMRPLAILWVVVALYSVYLLLAIPPATWAKHMWSLAGGWNLLTHVVTIVGGPLAAFLIWRNRAIGFVLLALVAGNAVLFWSIVAVVTLSTHPPLLATIALGVVTMGVLVYKAVKRWLSARRTDARKPANEVA
jgi:hypothetical protein